MHLFEPVEGFLDFAVAPLKLPSKMVLSEFEGSKTSVEAISG
jgi:hypothetical protein